MNDTVSHWQFSSYYVSYYVNIESIFVEVRTSPVNDNVIEVIDTFYNKELSRY